MSLVMFSNKLQSGNSSSRKAMEQWWFSNGEMSLYLEGDERTISEQRKDCKNFSLSTSAPVPSLHLSGKHCCSRDDPSHDKCTKSGG